MRTVAFITQKGFVMMLLFLGSFWFYNSFRKNDSTPCKISEWEDVIFLPFRWLSCYSHRFIDLNGEPGASRYSNPVTSFYRWHCLALCIVSFTSLHDTGSSVTAGIWWLCSLLCPQCPSQHWFRCTEQMKNQGRGKRRLAQDCPASK